MCPPTGQLNIREMLRFRAWWARIWMFRFSKVKKAVTRSCASIALTLRCQVDASAHSAALDQGITKCTSPRWFSGQKRAKNQIWKDSPRRMTSHLRASNALKCHNTMSENGFEIRGLKLIHRGFVQKDKNARAEKINSRPLFWREKHTHTQISGPYLFGTHKILVNLTKTIPRKQLIMIKESLRNSSLVEAPARLLLLEFGFCERAYRGEIFWIFHFCSWSFEHMTIGTEFGLPLQLLYSCRDEFRFRIRIRIWAVWLVWHVRGFNSWFQWEATNPTAYWDNTQNWEALCCFGLLGCFRPMYGSIRTLGSPTRPNPSIGSSNPKWAVLGPQIPKHNRGKKTDQLKKKWI